MPRGGRGGGRSSSPPPRSSASSSQPTYSRPTPPPAQSSGGMFSGFGSTIMQGMAFGAGSEVAHQAVRGVMGGGNHAQQPQQQYAQQQQQNPQACMNEINMLTSCLSTNSDISYCQNFSDMLKECQKHNGL